MTYPQVTQAIFRLSVRLYCGHMVNAAYYSKVNQGLRLKHRYNLTPDKTVRHVETMYI